MLTAVNFFPPEKIRFLFYSAENVYLRKSVKYNLKTAINQKGREEHRIPEHSAFKITQKKHNLSALKTFVKGLSPIFAAKETAGIADVYTGGNWER